MNNFSACMLYDFRKEQNLKHNKIIHFISLYIHCVAKKGNPFLNYIFKKLMKLDVSVKTVINRVDDDTPKQVILVANQKMACKFGFFFISSILATNFIK